MSAPESNKMGDRNESEGSYSGESSSSSSDSSSGSSDGEEEVMEQVTALGRTLQLPQELCEDYAVFKEFFSMDTWNSLSDENKERLKQFLPKFTENEQEETEKTIKMLFNFEPFHFTSPLGDFFNNLRQGNYRPDIANMRNFLKKARTEQQKHRKTAYYAKLLPELLISRERLITAAKGMPPGPIPHLPTPPPKPSSKDNYKSIFLRTKQRYFEELASIRSEVGGEESDDENYPDGPPEVGGKKKKIAAGQSSGESNISGTLGARDPSNPTSLECLKNVLAIHRMRRQYRDNHPELDTGGITLDDIKQRVAVVNGAKKLMFGGQKGDGPVQKLKRGPKPKTGVESAGKQSRPPEKGGKKKEDPIVPQDSVENRPLLPNIKIKCEQEESDSESSSFVDPITSPKPSRKPEEVEIKEEVIDPRYNVPNVNFNEPSLESVIKQEPIDHSGSQNSARVIQPVPIKLEDLDGIDMMALPVEIADDSGEVVQVNTSDTADEPVLDPDEALTETTHANFLSLVRALFPARAAHRASKQQLHARLAAVMKSPIAPLNTWYSLADDWCSELDSALSFMAGERGPHPEEFVPYLQYMPESRLYQWIGAGRDCDALLGRLCERWLVAASPPPPAEPPPAKYPTSWVVRAPTTAEIIDFRAQERKRFASAAKPFTYVQFGYRSVVGPCARATVSCASHAGLLVAERPRHAGFVALVRDAVARLPNGEGTRHDVVTLLKMSQWIAPCTDIALLSAVSSALDKLHSAKRDPMVKYDQQTAIWTYLHRHKSEEDWMKTGGGRSRANKTGASAANAPQRQAQSAAAAPPPAHIHLTPPHAMEMEVASVEEVVDNGSDTDVDVDDSSSPSGLPQLSSAQLLMQAARTHPPTPTPAPKSKGKLVAVSPPKPKPTKQVQPKPSLPPPKQPIFITQKTATSSPPIKPNLLVAKAPAKPQTPKPTLKPSVATGSPKANLMAQAAKQASLMAQSAKQASVISQLTKQMPPKQNVVSKQVNVVKQLNQSPKSAMVKPVTVPKPVQLVKQDHSPVRQEAPKTPVAKPAPPPVPAPNKSPLMIQKPLQKPVDVTTAVSSAILTQVSQPIQPVPAVVSPVCSVASVAASKLVPTRSLLIRASAAPTTVTAANTTPTSQATTGQRRGIVRVLTPTTPTGGKSLISPRALMQQGTPTTKKRVIPQETPSVNTVAQGAANVTTVVSSVPTAVTSSVSTRTVQLAGGRTVQLAANQTVHLPGGQAVQLTSGHTLQLSSLQLPTHSVRLPSGQTVQLASPQAIRAVSTTVKTSSPRPQQTVSSPTIKTAQSGSVQIPISSVQIAGQTVQIAGQTMQFAGQSVQLTGHTVKLPSGQSVQVASPSVLQSQSVQLPSGQTVQLSSRNVQAVQLGQNVLNQASGVQLSGQTVQLGGQTVQLSSGQTLQLSGQTVQLSSGQTIQLASGQTVQLANQQPKSVEHVARSQGGEKTAQPIVAKLLTNAQGQMISLESGGARALQVSGVRVVPPARPHPHPHPHPVPHPHPHTVPRPRPLLLAAKPHNMFLQQSDGTAIRVTSSGGVSTSQTIVLSNMGQAVTSSMATPPVLKLQQVNTLQQVKLPHGIKLQQASPSVSGASPGVRSVVMDAQQLKLVGGRHVLARILRPAQPPQPPPQ